MATWYTADQHFGHANIIRYTHRPFASVAEMNDELIRQWNAVVAPDDTVWCLGDLALGSPVEATIALTAQLNGTRMLVPGNHDRVSSVYEGGDQRERFTPVYEAAGWSIQPEVVQHTIDGYPVLLCHFPYRGDSHGAGDRFERARPADTGLPIVHGHVHDEFASDGRQLNVGVDVRDFTPVSEQEVAAWLASVMPPDGRLPADR